MTPRFLRLLLPALLALASLTASAQTPCVSGIADEDGNPATTNNNFACNEVDLLSRIPLSGFAVTGLVAPSSSAEIWGWTDPETSREYALIGLSNGLGFVDVTTPTAPVVVGRLLKPTGATGNNSWQSLRVYNNYVFLGSERSSHGIQIFDLTRLRGVTTPTAFTQDARYAGVGNSHTISINEATGFLYIVGASSCGGGLHIVNIQNPLAPVQVGCYATDGYTHEAQCLTYDGPDTDYQGRQLCVAYQGQGGDVNGGKVSFVDVTNPALPVLISSASFPLQSGTSYSHQGWFTADKRHILVNDEFDTATPGTRTIVMNVEDLDNPTFDFNYNGPLRTYAHNLYIIGQLAYTSNYTSGLRILDISGVDQNTFTSTGFFDTLAERRNTQGQVTCAYPCNDLSYNGQWMNYPFFASGTIVASDIQNGFFALRYTGQIPTASEGDEVPADAFALGAAYPNPFAASATLPLTVGTAQHVRAEAFDVLGRRVAVLFDGPLAAGATTRLVLDGAALPAGRYVVRVVGETFAETRQLSLVR